MEWMQNSDGEWSLGSENGKILLGLVASGMKHSQLEKT